MLRPFCVCYLQDVKPDLPAPHDHSVSAQTNGKNKVMPSPDAIVNQHHT